MGKGLRRTSKTSGRPLPQPVRDHRKMTMFECRCSSSSHARQIFRFRGLIDDQGNFDFVDTLPGAQRSSDSSSKDSRTGFLDSLVEAIGERLSGSSKSEIDEMKSIPPINCHYCNSPFGVKCSICRNWYCEGSVYQKQGKPWWDCPDCGKGGYIQGTSDVHGAGTSSSKKGK